VSFEAHSAPSYVCAALPLLPFKKIFFIFSFYVVLMNAAGSVHWPFS
jgi:hypothetical protein